MPRSWDEAAAIVCDELAIAWFAQQPDQPSLEESIVYLREWFEYGSAGAELTADNWVVAGVSALNVAFAGQSDPAFVQRLTREVRDLIITKQHDYGDGNILAFGHRGIVVRMSDKFARLRNLQRKGVDARNEPLIDTKMDLVGYAALGMMLSRHWFGLPLEGEDKAGEPLQVAPSDAA